jgi:hypothetical protein
MYAQVSKSVSRILVLAVAALMPVALAAQDSAKPAAKTPSDDYASKWDIFLGYSYLAPSTTVNTLQDDGTTTLATKYKASEQGITESVAYYFNRYAGLQFEAGQHDLWVNSSSSNSGIATFEPGLIFRYPTAEITPFVHGLVGLVDADGPDHEPYTWGIGLTAGGGLDYATPWFNKHLAIRVFQVDYEYFHVNSGSTSGYDSNGNWVYRDRENVSAIKLSAGLVYHIGSQAPPTPVTLAVTVDHSSIFPGDPVTATAVAGNLEPKLNVVYAWSGPGVTGTGATAQVATAALAPGSYTVKATVKEGKPGKEGLKPWELADASASFTVKAFEPPTISCAASPTTINPGDTVTVTASAVSPQNRPLTYTYSVAPGTGSINGSGATATYSSTGAPTGAVAITCNVADDKGGVASSTTTVTIALPPTPPLPHASAICPIAFDKDKKRPVRVDNEAKACLDQVTDALKKDPTATVAIVGETTTQEKTQPKSKHAKHPVAPEDFAAERAVNTKDYLANEEQSGIEASRITVYTGTTDSKSVENYFVPAGATFTNDVQGATPVNETAVKKLTRKPIPVSGAPKAHKKKAAAKPAQ